MLLSAKFRGFTFTFGVRVSRVIDDRQQDERGDWQTRFGYAYRTLQGHREVCEMQCLIVKQESTGKVEITMDAYSKYDRIANPFYR